MKAYLSSRISDKKQKTGKGLERQTQWAQDWCQRRGIPLDDTLTFSDPGQSAFRGKNHLTGALSLFLKACEQGRIKPGSFLIVENLDRLSHERSDPHPGRRRAG